MPFDTDQQTLADLSLTGINGQPAIYQIFKPVTLGGLALLKDLFDRPLNDIETIQQRIDAIRFLDANQSGISFDKEEADFIEYYLKTYQRPGTTSKIMAIKNGIKNRLRPHNPYYITTRGVRLLTAQIIGITEAFEPYDDDLPVLLRGYREQANVLAGHIRKHLIQKLKIGKSFSATEQEELDFIYRYKQAEAVKHFMAGLYQLDVFMAAAQTTRNLNFTYPELTAGDKPELNLQGFFHPFIAKPVTNNIEFNGQQNLCFVTGANMAGKSTVLKSIGICVYLAHIGFPVPAMGMRTTVFNGLLTTINLADNLMAGHSHFYREVLRIKEVARKTGSVKNILVIFDELFRGTNVKDAHDASLAIIKAFAGVKDSVFVVSTHIVEVANELQGADNIFFRCLTTGIKDQKAVYNYKLQPGISHERLGMRIIEDEGLVAMIQAQQ